MTNWSVLTEQQIRKAQAEGQFDNLPGAGKPQDLSSGNDMVSAGFRIMAGSGVVPREIELKKAVEAQRLAYRNASGDAERRGEMKKLTDLELRLAIEQEARRKYFR